MGLQFLGEDGEAIAKWTTSHLSSGPKDDFVLTPLSRIAFDIRAQVNSAEDSKAGLRIVLPAGTLRVKFRYEMIIPHGWYDYLNKGSRFADMTPPWEGIAISNEITFENGTSPSAR